MSLILPIVTRLTLERIQQSFLDTEMLLMVVLATVVYKESSPKQHWDRGSAELIIRHSYLRYFFQFFFLLFVFILLSLFLSVPFVPLDLSCPTCGGRLTRVLCLNFSSYTDLCKSTVQALRFSSLFLFSLLFFFSFHSFICWRYRCEISWRRYYQRIKIKTRHFSLLSFVFLFL